MTRTQRFFISIVLAWAICFSNLAIPSENPEQFEIDLIHINDVYQIDPIDPSAQRGSLARLATLVKSVRQKNPEALFLFGGDTISPSVESSLFKGSQMIAAWNAMQLDFAVLGNHEFDFGEDVLRARLKESKFQWLAANVSANPALPFKSSELRSIHGVKVGFVGLITPETATLSKPGANIHFDALLKAAEREVAKLRSDGAEIIIGLTHNTLAEDRLLAGTGLFDMIVGGHDHHLITERFKSTPILKAGSDARDALHIKLKLLRHASKSKLLNINWEVLPIDSRWQEDPHILKLAAEFKTKSDVMLQETIAATDTALDARTSLVRQGECNICNFVTDTIRIETNSDIVIMNAGGFRSDRIIAAGAITKQDIRNLLPFQNALVQLSISGEQLLLALEHGLNQRITHGRSGAFPHVSGMRLRYTPNASKGQRILAIEINGSLLKRDKIYSLTTNDYLAQGGDGYDMLKNLPVLQPAEALPTETELIIQALERAGRINPSIDGRMEILP